MERGILKALILATTAMVPAASAFAQVAQDEELRMATAGDFSEIVVTARRIEERLQDVPISITVFNQEQLIARNMINSTDLATYTPSLAVNQRYGPEKASFVIRGFSQDLQTVPTVAVYFADAGAPRLSSNITSGGGAGVGQLFDLENVQVLKGPQGTLFGRNTTGGAILLVPRKPTDKLEGYVEGTYGNHDARRVQAVFNLPVTDWLKARAGFDRYKRDGYLNNRSGIGPDHFNDLNYWSARFSMLAELTPNFENYTVFTASKTDTNGYVGRVVDCNRGTIVGSSGRFSPTRAQVCAMLDRVRAEGQGFHDVEGNLPNPFIVQTFRQLINTTTWNVSDSLTIKNIFSYARSKEKYAFNLTGDNVPAGFAIATFPGPDTGQDTRGNLTEELQIQGTAAGGRLRWQAGGYLERNQPIGGQFGSQQQYTAIYVKCNDIYSFQCAPFSVAGSISISNNVYTNRTHGFYAQATYDLTEKFAITGGIRNTWEYASVSANNVRIVPTLSGVPTLVTCSRAATPSPNPGLGLVNNPACTRSFTEKSNKPTWLINLDYKPNEDTLIYAKWARGYRGGGVNEANVGLETWGPEKLDTYEVGLKASFSGVVSGNINVAGFWNEFKDQQLTVSLAACTNAPTCAPTGIAGIQNVASSRVRGAEVDGTLRLTRDLRFDFGYAYLDAKVTGGSVPFCDNTRFLCAQASFFTKGTRLTFTPKHRATISAIYTLPLDKTLGDISVGGTLTYTAKQFSSHASDVPFAQGVLAANYGILPSLTLLNLNMSWRNVGGSPVDLGLFGTNVTNKKYNVAGGGSLATTGGEFVLAGEPRMYGLRLRYNFGQ